MMNPQHVIIHERSVYKNSSQDPRQQEVLEELRRIHEFHKPLMVNHSDPKLIPDGLDRTRLILVCGAYYSGFLNGRSSVKLCVDLPLEALLAKDYRAEVHEKGVLYSITHQDHPFHFNKPQE